MLEFFHLCPNYLVSKNSIFACKFFRRYHDFLKYFLKTTILIIVDHKQYYGINYYQYEASFCSNLANLEYDFLCPLKEILRSLILSKYIKNTLVHFIISC